MFVEKQIITAKSAQRLVRNGRERKILMASGEGPVSEWVSLHSPRSVNKKIPLRDTFSSQ